VRTRTATVELAERLSARGFSTAAMNGDMPQSQREQMVDKLKSGSLDILVATDVVARGLDVDRISHVINYDIPYDTEAYVHRIGRTGRAGRSGDAILFVTPREQRLLHSIEKTTRQKIEKLELPTVEMVNNRRIADFKQSISDTLAKGELSFLQQLIRDYVQEHDVPNERVAAALASLCLRGQSLQLKEEGKTGKGQKQKNKKDKGPKKRINSAMDSRVTEAVLTESRDKPAGNPARQARNRKRDDNLELETYRVEVGSSHDVKASNLVGAIANEAGIDSQFIGRIKINEEHSTIDLPTGMPKFLLKDLKRVWVCNRRLDISRVSDGKSTGSDETNNQDSKSRKAATTEISEKRAPQAKKKYVAKSKSKRDKKRKDKKRNKKTRNSDTTTRA